jgi:hypothetical protein
MVGRGVAGNEGECINIASTGKMKEPRWAITFLRALERTGQVRLAAKDAGIDHSTAYARRKAHREFAHAWAAALEAHAAAIAQAEAEEIAAVRERQQEPLFSGEPELFPKGQGDCREHAISGGQVKRVNKARWGKRAEALFFATLAETANVKLAAEAAGFSTTALYARRLRHLAFQEKWAAAVDTARARLDLGILELANRAIEEAVAGVSNAAPKMSISEALHILKLGAEPRAPTGTSSRRTGHRAGASDRLASDQEVRAALVKSLKAFGVRIRREDLANGQGSAGDSSNVT